MLVSVGRSVSYPPTVSRTTIHSPLPSDSSKYLQTREGHAGALFIALKDLMWFSGHDAVQFLYLPIFRGHMRERHGV